MAVDENLVVPEDDQFHVRDDDPHWNESSWISFMIPERGLGGMIYFGHRPNMKLSGGGPIMWDRSGKEIYDCLYWDWDYLQPMPDGADMYEFSLENTLTLEVIELQKKYHMTYDRDGCKVDLTWEAILEPQLMTLRGPDGLINPAVVEWVRDSEGTETNQLKIGHYETFGRMRGTVELDGELMQVDCFSGRDRSWGPRRVQYFPKGFYLWSVESELDSFFAIGAAHTDEAVDEAILPLTAGWYTKDGIKGNLISGERVIPKRGEDGCPLVTIIDAVDEHGRELHAEAHVEVPFKWTGYTRCYDWWNLATWSWNDGHAAWGEAHDYYTFRESRRFQLSLRERHGKKP